MALKQVNKDVDADSADTLEFRISATDTKGHSARQWYRCIPAMAAQIEQWVASKKFPYRTSGDLQRHAIYRHMRYLGSLEPAVSVTGQVDVILEIMRDDELNKDFLLVFNKLGERVASHVEAGCNKEALRLLLTIQQQVNSMPDGFWRSKYQDEIKKKYGHLLKGATTMKLEGV